MKLIGATKARHDLDEIGRKLANPTSTMRREARMLEVAERGVFASLGGRYVDTGRTRDSLTSEGGADAVRRATPFGLEFGTQVEYARYLTERIGPETPAGGMKRPLPVAVLKLSHEQAERVARDVMNDITGKASAATSLVSSYLGGSI